MRIEATDAFVPTLANEIPYLYNGIEHIGDLGLDINTAFYRTLDPALGRWWQIDPKAEAFYALSPYNSMGNNPILKADPNGDFWHIVIGAAIGGAINVATHWNKINSFGDGIMAFGIGAAGGAVTAATGGAVAGALGGFGATAGALTGAGGGGIIGGAVTGSVGAILGSPVQGVLNSAYFHDNYNGQQWAMDVAGGFVFGAAAGGISAAISGKNIWTGMPKMNGIGPLKMISPSAHRSALIKSGDWGINKYGQLAKAKPRAYSVDIDPLTGTWADGRTFTYGLLNPKFTHIALGVNQNLDEFAKGLGAQTHEIWAPNNGLGFIEELFERDFFRTVNNPNVRIHFDLTLRNGEMMNPWKAMSAARAYGFKGGVTNWELYQIWTNPSLLSRTTFWYQGQITTIK